jgi:hypothetical protein
MAQRVVHQVVQVLTPNRVPLFLTEGATEYATTRLGKKVAFWGHSWHIVLRIGLLGGQPRDDRRLVLQTFP